MLTQMVRRKVNTAYPVFVEFSEEIELRPKRENKFEKIRVA